jgi:hypothetical protein
MKKIYKDSWVNRMMKDHKKNDKEEENEDEFEEEDFIDIEALDLQSDDGEVKGKHHPGDYLGLGFAEDLSCNLSRSSCMSIS